MSNPYSSEQLTHICDDARRVATRAADHQIELEAVVRAAESTLHSAEVALASSRVERTEAEMQPLLSDHVRRASESTEAARRACVSAREQQVTAGRLLSRLDDRVGDQTPIPPRGVAVLVVDDAEDVRQMVASVLRDAGFVVRTAVNGLEGLLGAYEMQPTVIVMDMTMPVLDGLEATRLIKAMTPTRDVRVIAYTANPSIAGLLAQRLFVAVLPKPCTSSVLLAAVQDVARGAGATGS